MLNTLRSARAARAKFKSCFLDPPQIYFNIASGRRNLSRCSIVTQTLRSFQLIYRRLLTGCLCKSRRSATSTSFWSMHLLNQALKGARAGQDKTQVFAGCQRDLIAYRGDQVHPRQWAQGRRGKRSATRNGTGVCLVIRLSSSFANDVMTAASLSKPAFEASLKFCTSVPYMTRLSAGI